MQVDIKTHHLELTQQIEAYLNEKLEDVERLIDAPSEAVYARVQLGKKDEQHQSGKIYTAKVNLNIAGADYRATAREESIEAAIDEIKDELMKKLRREKDKQQSLVKRGGRAVKEFIHGFRR